VIVRRIADDRFVTPIPETTSAEAYECYIGGKCLRACRGEAWHDIKAFVVDSTHVVNTVHLPGVSEPFLAWTMSGEAEFQERENDGPWITNRIKRGSLFLTNGGGIYDCRWKMLNAEPLETMLVFIELPLLLRAFDEIFGKDAANARLKNLSAFTDPALHRWMEQLHSELMRKKASALYVQGIAQSVAVHLARQYAALVSERQSGSPSLPGFKLRQITDWMVAHLTEEFELERLAEKAGLSKFHFIRLFKNATGVSPSQYHINLRIDLARKLLRETDKSIITVALDVGYTNPSHFAQLFRRVTGLSPSQYRRQR
jgi:AraC family transcriptional regulator